MNRTTPPPGTIVVGVDGSAPSDLAVLWAAEQATLEHRPLTLAHGTGLPQVSWVGGPYGGDPATLIDGVQGHGARLLDASRSSVAASHPGLEVVLELTDVDPRRALLDLSRDATMVVLGSRGLGTVAGLVLGSVSGAVSHHAGCPVVVLRPREPGVVPTRGILLGIDRNGRSRSAVEFAYRQASLRHRPLTVTHCVDPFGTSDADRYGTEIAYDSPGYDDGRLILDETVAGMGEKFPDVEVSLTLGLAPAERYLAASSGAFDLVVVGSHTGSALLGHLSGPHVDRALLRHAGATVAVVDSDD